MQNKHQDIHGTKIRMQWIAQPRRNQKIESEDVPCFSLANRGEDLKMVLTNTNRGVPKLLHMVPDISTLCPL